MVDGTEKKKGYKERMKPQRREWFIIHFDFKRLIPTRRPLKDSSLTVWRLGSAREQT